MVGGSWIFLSLSHTTTHTTTHTRTLGLGQQTPAPLSEVVVNRWGKAQLLWQAKTQQERIPPGERRKGGEEREERWKEGDGGGERRQLGCRWVPTLCILPDNDGGRVEEEEVEEGGGGGGETVRENGGGKARQKKKKRMKRLKKMCVCCRQRRWGVRGLILLGIKRLTQSGVHLCRSEQLSLTDWPHDWLTDWQKSLSDNWQTVGAPAEWLPGYINHSNTRLSSNVAHILTGIRGELAKGNESERPNRLGRKN